jgi:mannosyltransferase
MATIHFDGIIYSLQRHGGISVYASELAKRLLENPEYDFHLDLFDGTSPLADEFASRAHFKKSRILERLRQYSTPDNVLLSQSTYYRIPRDCSIPLVTVVHDFTVERYGSGIRKILHSWQKRRAIRQADAVVCISHNTANDLAHYVPGVPSDRIVVIPNGVSDLFFNNSLRPSGSTNEVLFVGSRFGYKNFDLAVSTIKNLPSFSLVCVGGGPISSAEHKVLEKSLPGRYRHAGYVTDQELHQLYKKAYALIYPSAYEGFGIPVIEAMASCCPVIALKRSSIPEVAGDAGILLDDEDAGDFAEALASLQNHSVREACVDAGRRRARDFSWDRTFQETLSVYNKVIHQSESRPKQRPTHETSDIR